MRRRVAGWSQASVLPVPASLTRRPSGGVAEVGGVVEAAQGEGGAVGVALAGVVEDDVEDGADAGGAEGGDGGGELGRGRRGRGGGRGP